jgi:hypothetical protein
LHDDEKDKRLEIPAELDSRAGDGFRHSALRQQWDD